jgi:hypothetical protein
MENGAEEMEPRQRLNNACESCFLLPASYLGTLKLGVLLLLFFRRSYRKLHKFGGSNDFAIFMGAASNEERTLLNDFRISDMPTFHKYCEGSRELVIVTLKRSFVTRKINLLKQTRPTDNSRSKCNCKSDNIMPEAAGQLKPRF